MTKRKVVTQRRGTHKSAHPTRTAKKSSYAKSRPAPTGRLVAVRPRAAQLTVTTKRVDIPQSRDGYHPDFAERVFKLMLLGLTQEEIAAHLDVSWNRFRGWKPRHPDLVAAIKRGLDAPANLAASLYQRGCGYSHPEEKVFCTKDGDIVTYDTIKHYPPSEVAAMMFLSNRDGVRWKNQQSMDHTNSDGSFGAFAQAAKAVSNQVKPGRLLEHDAEDAEIVEPEPTSPLRGAE